MSPREEALALAKVASALLSSGVTRAERAFIADCQLYKLAIERIKDEIEMQRVINQEADLPSLPDGTYAIDPADTRST